MSRWSKLIEEEVKVLPEAERVVGLLRASIEGRSSVIVSSVGVFKSAGRYLAHLVNSLTNVNAFYVRPCDLMYYLVPYNEGRELDVVLVATPEGLSELYPLLDQLVLTGHRVALVSDPLPEAVRQRYEGVSMVELSPSKMSLLKLLAIMAYSVSRLARGELRRRAERILGECASLGQVVDELLEKYDEDLRSLREVYVEPHVVTYTPTMEPAAELLALSSKSLVIPADISSAYLYVDKFARKVVAFTTEVELYTVRYYLSRITERGGRVKELRIRTDPLTAPLYALTLVYSMGEPGVEASSAHGSDRGAR